MAPWQAGNGPAGPLLILDYPGYRVEARVTDLRLDEDGFRCISLLTDPLPTEFGGHAYAERLRTRVAGDPGAVTAVLGYCQSASLACEMLTLLPGAPKLVLFDAERVTEETVVQAYLAALAGYGSPTDAAPPGDLVRDPGAAVSSMVGELERKAAAAFTAEGCDPGEAAELGREAGTAWRDWLTHLVAAHRTPAPRWQGEVLHVMSADYRGPERWLPRAAGVRCDVPARELLRCAAARNAVLDFLS